MCVCFSEKLIIHGSFMGHSWVIHQSNSETNGVPRRNTSKRASFLASLLLAEEAAAPVGPTPRPGMALPQGHQRNHCSKM